MIDDLLLLSGNDIPFVEGQMNIHQPTIKEIALMTEENFFEGLQMLNFSKNMLSEEDKVNLENQNDFDIFIAILKERNAVMQKNRNCVLMVLALLFPEYTIEIVENSITFGNEEKNEKHFINSNNFESFKIILNKIFPLEKNNETEKKFSGTMAKKIAEKLQKRHDKLSELKGPQKIAILSRYVSILAVGESKDMNNVLNYTFYQLMDEIDRFYLKQSYDIYIQAKMAGAKDLKEVDDWMKDIHLEDEQDKK